MKFSGRLPHTISKNMIISSRLFRTYGMAFLQRKKGAGKTSNSRKIRKGKKNVNAACLRRELEMYKKKGVSLDLEGCPSSPYEIVKAHLIAETGGYMRDYQQDEKGGLQKIGFDRIRL